MAGAKPLPVPASSAPTTTTARRSAYSTNVWPCSARIGASSTSSRDIGTSPFLGSVRGSPTAPRQEASRLRLPAERPKGQSELDHRTRPAGGRPTFYALAVQRAGVGAASQTKFLLDESQLPRRWYNI